MSTGAIIYAVVAFAYLCLAGYALWQVWPSRKENQKW